jgi:hypothetical protein
VTTIRRQANTVEALQPIVAKEEKAMSKEQSVDTAPVWERLYPVRRHCHGPLSAAITAACLIAFALGTLGELLWSTFGAR